jgi:hypothetical protein
MYLSANLTYYTHMDLTAFGTWVTTNLGGLAGDAFAVLAIVFATVFVPLVAFKGAKAVFGRFTKMGK